MESYEASKTVFTRVQNIDPENASKIMGYILLHHGEHDMLQLSFANEPFFLNLVSRAKSHLGLSSNTSSALLLNPVSDPVSIPRPDPLSVSLSSLGLSTGFDPTSPSSPSIWSPHHVPLNPNTLVFSSSSSSSTTSAVDDFQLKDHHLGPFMSDPGVLSGKSSDFSDQSLDFSGDFNNGHNVFHRRSASFNDNMSYFGGGSCGGGGGGGGGFSDDNYDAVYERQEQIFRAKLAHQQRLASQLMNSGVSLPYNKLNFLHSEAQRSAAALMMSEELNKLNRVRMARHELLGLDCNPASRQIYLTFPADSTFKEEDVSNYFNKFGPVQDVRIPYQQKRMFGFVTFIFPETVKIILAKGNPHFVCDSRVLVKPYKEKGKLPDKKQHQHQFERGEFSCSSLSEHDREPYDFQLGGRMMYNAQEMLLRKKLEEAEYQHALELQERRLMNLQMFDLKNQQNQHSISVGSSVPSPNRTAFSPFDDIRQDVVEENKGSSTESDVEFSSKEVNVSLSDSNLLKKEGSSPHREENTPFEELDDVLPDSLFTSPAKSSANTHPPEINNDVVVPGASSTTDKDAPAPAAVPPSSSAANTALKSCFSETPRVSTEHDGPLGM